MSDVNQQIVDALHDLVPGDILIRNGDITLIPYRGAPQTFQHGDFGSSHLDQMALVAEIRDYFAKRAKQQQTMIDAPPIDTDERILELLDNPYCCEITITFGAIIIRRRGQPTEILRRIGSDVKGFGMWSAIKTYFEWLVNKKDEHGLFKTRDKT